MLCRLGKRHPEKTQTTFFAQTRATTHRSYVRRGPNHSNTISDFAMAADATNPGKARAPSIREGSAEKAELIALFESKQWKKLPPENKDAELEAILTKHGWNRTQLSRHLGFWKNLGGNVSKNIDRPRDGIVKSLRETCHHSANELLEKTWSCRDVTSLLPLVTFPDGSRKKMEDVSLWEGFMDDIFGKVADNHASSGNRIPQMSAKQCLSTEELTQDLWKTFAAAEGLDAEESPIRSFFYVFANAFHSMLSSSCAEPDLDAKEEATIKSILAGKDVSLPKAHGEALYFILGFVIKAVEEEGIRRKSKGSLMKVFAERNSLTDVQVKKAIEDEKLPLQKTARQSEGGLRYPTNHFYKTCAIVERIYCALLSDVNLQAFGATTMIRIDEKISQNKEIRSMLAVPVGKNAEGVDAVVDFLLRTYRRIRGSDFANKLLARGDKSCAVATRTELQTLSDVSRMKKKQRVESKPADEDEIAFEKECAAGLAEFTACCVADEEQLVRDELYSESENEDNIEMDNDESDTE